MWEKSNNKSAASSTSAPHDESRGEGYALDKVSSYRQLNGGGTRHWFAFLESNTGHRWLNYGNKGTEEN